MVLARSEGILKSLIVPIRCRRGWVGADELDALQPALGQLGTVCGFRAANRSLTTRMSAISRLAMRVS